MLLIFFEILITSLAAVFLVMVMVSLGLGGVAAIGMGMIFAFNNEVLKGLPLIVLGVGMVWVAYRLERKLWS